jgi:hypothetical protein
MQADYKGHESSSAKKAVEMGEQGERQNGEEIRVYRGCYPMNVTSYSRCMRTLKMRLYLIIL